MLKMVKKKKKDFKNIIIWAKIIAIEAKDWTQGEEFLSTNVN